jgi:hypothetical protein
MKPVTKREHSDALRRPFFIAPGSAIPTQQLPKNVLPRAGLKHVVNKTETNGGFGIWKSGSMSVLKIGRRHGFFGWRHAPELTSRANHVRHATFQPRQPFAAINRPNSHVGCFAQGGVSTLPQSLYLEGAVPVAGHFPRLDSKRTSFTSHIIPRRFVATLQVVAGDTASATTNFGIHGSPNANKQAKALAARNSSNYLAQ